MVRFLHLSAIASARDAAKYSDDPPFVGVAVGLGAM